MESNYIWLYLAIFLLIPLSRIIPRYLRKRMNKQNQQTEYLQNDNSIPKSKSKPQTEYLQNDNSIPKSKSKPQTEYLQNDNSIPKSKPQTNKMKVLGALNSGLRTFEAIQKDTDLENKKLDEILANLERDGLLYVNQKQGMLGTKIELHLTEKGLKEYYS